MRALLVVAVVSLVACGGDDSPPPGNPAVFDRIAGMVSCADLQAEFDTAIGNVERFPAGSSERVVPLAYAEAVVDRMLALGCP